MTEITLITTVHRPKGNCNPVALYKIIEDINPDVIFEEQSQQNHNLIYSGQWHDTVETICIKEFLKVKQVDHFPVDIERNMSSELQNKFAKVFSPFQNNFQYQNLLLQRDTLARQSGFRFLNSESCLRISEELRLMEAALNSSSKNLEEIETYKKWTEMQELRETEMLKNIYRICEEKNYAKGLFLVGTEHRKSLTEKILNNYAENKTIVWNFKYFSQ